MGPSQAGLGPGATAAVASGSLGSDSPVLSCSLAQATADRTAGLPSSQSPEPAWARGWAPGSGST